jgi:hypothetical protein
MSVIGFIVQDSPSVRVERVHRNFVVYGNTLRELGEAAALEAAVFYGDLPFRITLLDVEERTEWKRGGNHPEVFGATAYTESP